MKIQIAKKMLNLSAVFAAVLVCWSAAVFACEPECPDCWSGDDCDVYDCDPNQECCGGTCYDPETEKCCDDAGDDNDYICDPCESCCDGVCYDPETERCCDPPGDNNGYNCARNQCCGDGECIDDGDECSDTDECCCEGDCGMVNSVAARTKSTGQTLYRANNYLDEPDKRPVVNQIVQATFSGSCAECFLWSPNCPEDPGSYPRICPDDSSEATFSAKDHRTYEITASCHGCSKSMNIAIEGINIKTSNISEADEMTKTYNIFLNENFDQQLNPQTPAGHTTCYDKDNSDDSIQSDSGDEIGTITLVAETCEDSDAQVKFSVSPTPNIKLYKNSTEQITMDTYYLASSLPGSLRVEGTSIGTTTLTATIKTQDNYTATDQLKIKVIPLNETAVSPAPSSDQHEICHKDNLIIPVNNNDSDSDGTVDLNDTEVTGGDPDIAKVTLHKPTGAVDSDISGNITVTFPMKVNAWKNQDKTGGSAPTTYSLSSLPVDIYLEGKTASSDILDSKIEVEMTLDSGVKCHDEIRYTIIKIEKIPLGSSAGLGKFIVGKVYVPTKYGGKLTLSGGTNIELFYTGGSDLDLDTAYNIIVGDLDSYIVAQGNPCEYDVPDNKHLWYYVKVTSSASVSSTFVQEGQASTRPWNGWYWPLPDSVNPNLYDNGYALDKYDQVYSTSAQSWEQNNHSGGEGWYGHCWGWSVASILQSQPSGTIENGVSFTQDDMEGLYSELADCGAYINPSKSVSDIPSGPPSPGSDSTDSYCDNFHNKLRINLRGENDAVQSNLRDAGGSDPCEVWNHAIWKYSATMEEASGGDEHVIQITTTIYANEDFDYPSTGTSDRTETYSYKVEYNSGEINENYTGQDWISADAFAPKNIWLIYSSEWDSNNPDVTKTNVDDLY